MLTVEVDIPKTDYEVFSEIAKQCDGEDVPPAMIMRNYLMDFADQYRKNNPEIQVKTGCLESYEDNLIVAQAAGDKADEYGYIEPNFDKL